MKAIIKLSLQELKSSGKKIAKRLSKGGNMKSFNWKKSFLLISIIVIFAGCTAKKEAKSSAQNEPVTLRIAWWGSQKRHDATLAVLDLYTKKTGVQFEAEFLPFDGYFTKLNTLAAAKNVWDIYQLGSNFPNYAESLEPLDPFVKSGAVDVSQIGEGILSTTRLGGDGDLLGISIGTNTYGIAYDPEMFQKAGVPEPTETWTWKDYEKACLKIHEKLGVYGSSKLDDFIAGGKVRIPQHDKNQGLFSKDGKSLGYTDDSPIVDYWKIRKTLVDAKAYPDPGRIYEIKDIESDLLVRGEAAMTWVASNQFISLCSAAKRPLKMAVVPREKENLPLGLDMQSSQQFGVYSGSKNKEEAAKFISFFVNDIEANRILQGERGVPVSTPVRNDLETFLNNETQKELYSFMTVMSRNASMEKNFDVPCHDEIKDLYWRIEDKVAFGKATPEEAAKEFRREAEAIFAKTFK